MIAGNDKLEDKGAASVSGAASRSCLADVLLITRDREWAASTEKMLAENLYGASIALNGDQIVERLKGAWYHFALIDLDSIKEVKTGRRALKGLVLAAAIGIFLWVLLIWLWG